MDLLWRSSEDPPSTFGVTHCLSGPQHPTTEVSEDTSRVLEPDGTEEKKEEKGVQRELASLSHEYPRGKAEEEKQRLF